MIELKQTKRDIIGYMKEYKTKGYIPTGNPPGRPKEWDTIKKEERYVEKVNAIKWWVNHLSKKELKIELGKHLKYRNEDDHWRHRYDVSGTKFRLLFKRYRSICTNNTEG